MAKLNQCNFIGRLGRDPEIQSLPSGDIAAKFSIAIDASYKDKSGQKVDKAEWVNLVAYSKTAEIVERYLEKGMLVFVSSKVQTRKWQDKTSGADRHATEFVVQELQMLGNKGNGDTSSAPPQTSKQPEYSDDDIPF
jgi:single-strand DNA-binding protein